MNRKNSGMASEKPTGEVGQEPAKQHRRMSMINSLWCCNGFPSIVYVIGWRRGSSGGTGDRNDKWRLFKLRDSIALTYYLHFS